MTSRQGKRANVAKIDEDMIQEAYEEAITHLEMCAEQEQKDFEQRRAYIEVASRISRAADRSLRRNEKT